MPLTQFESSIYPTLVRNASDLLEAKPWMSLESTDVFAVQNPDSDEMVFVQVSGGVDQEPFMLTAYRGSRGLEILWDLNNSPEEAFVSDLNYEVPALFFTYVSLPPSWPTSTAARCGCLPPLATICFTSSAISALIAVAVAFPSINCILFIIWAFLSFPSLLSSGSSYRPCCCLSPSSSFYESGRTA